MALLLPAALSHNRHANDSSDIRRNLRLRYRDSYKHNREHEYCVEFEVIKASKACHKLPPYNLMLEGDRITVRCDLEALIPDTATSTTTSPPSTSALRITGKNPLTYHNKHKNMPSAANSDGNSNDNNNNNNKYEITNNSAVEEDDTDDDDEDADDDEENMLNVDNSSENDEYQSSWVMKSGGKMTTSTTPATTTAAKAPTSAHYHCRGEGLSGRTTRWSALPAPSCRGKWLRLTVGPPKKCTHAQFIFV